MNDNEKWNRNSIKAIHAAEDEYFLLYLTKLQISDLFHGPEKVC